MHPQPQPAYFDEARGAWVLSRYRDVTEALREPRLWPLAAGGEDQAVTRDGTGRLRLRGPVQEALSSAHVAAWQASIEPLAYSLLDGLPRDRPVDLLAGFALPWCLEFALLVLGAAPSDRGRLSALGAQVFAATGAPDGSPLRPSAAAATAELERLLAGGQMPMGEPTFVALSQTTPRLLASVWTALYSHPAEAERLRASPELWPGAVEELLRYAGIVRGIWRQARGSVEIGAAKMSDGQRAMLMLASANRDSEQWVEPDRLDVTRRVTSQLALGAGRHSCIGAGLVRMAVTVATQALFVRFPTARPCSEPQWRTGSGYCFPASLPVLLCANARTGS